MYIQKEGKLSLAEDKQSKISVKKLRKSPNLSDIYLGTGSI